MRPGNHPTKERLIATVVELLDAHLPEELSTASVLEHSGISTGSLYHFFDDWAELIEQALLRRFAAGVAASTAVIRAIVDESADAEEFFSRLDKVTHATQARTLADVRYERARLIVRSHKNERLSRELSILQQRLTDDLAMCFADAQAKGWLSAEFEPRTGAVYIQAYTLGRIVDDVTSTPMDDSDWNRLIGRIARKAFGA
jgi:AcrR family transcriptional regulator